MKYFNIIFFLLLGLFSCKTITIDLPVPDFKVVAELSAPEPSFLSLQTELAQYGITNYNYMLPSELFSFEALFTLRGFIMMVLGGFLVGFGTRYAGGCTSGHSIMGLSNLQWPSLVATICFMAGGFFMANIILPWILSL